MFNFPVTPPQASNFAVEYDILFYAITAVSAFFTIVIFALMAFFAVRYREGSKASRKNPIYHSNWLEAAWTIPLIPLALGTFFWGAKIFIDMRTMPENAHEISIIGKQWMWHAQHENGVRENNTLTVPVGRPVKLTMISQDVIHAFYIPAFRVQYHVVPGRYSQMWFTPTQAGSYHLFCGMYCGTQHSEMGGRVVVLEPKEFAEWLGNKGSSKQNLTMAQAGYKLFNKVGCANCHGGDASIRAPSLNGLLGKRREFSNSPPIIANEEYIRESILNPYNKLVSTYSEAMPVYKGQLSEEEILDLIAYIKTGNTGQAGGENALANVASGISGIPGNTIGDKTGLAVGAIQYGNERASATPTNKTNKLSVGAIAAEGTPDGEAK